MRIYAWQGLTMSIMLALGASAVAENQVEITEWEVPWENTRPRDPWVGGQDTIWFVGQRGDYVGRLNPQTGHFKRYDLEAGAGPHTVISDERGAWYAGNRAQHIGLLDPATGDIEKIMLPGSGPRDVHTLDFTSDGNIWFTVQGGNQVGLLRVEEREFDMLEVPTAGARPYGVIVDNHDQPWFALFGTHKLATVSDGELQEIPLPREESRPRRLAVTADGMVWYVDYAGGYLGRYNPETEVVKEWRTPGGESSRPYAMAADDKGRLWFVETGSQPNRFVGFEPATETFIAATDVPSGGGTVRHMVFDAERNSIWFGADTNTIGRARLP